VRRGRDALPTTVDALLGSLALSSVTHPVGRRGAAEAMLDVDSLGRTASPYTDASSSFHYSHQGRHRELPKQLVHLRR
jgi:hypothetical protein